MKMFEPLRKYADFEGRATRTEYWLFFLFRVLLFTAMSIGGFIAIAVTGGISDGAQAQETTAGVVALLLIAATLLVSLGLFIPTLAVGVRRLHDSDKSGFWLLLNFVPFGGLVVFIFDLIDGTPGPNRYGPDPKGRPGYGNTEVHHHHHYAAQ